VIGLQSLVVPEGEHPENLGFFYQLTAARRDGVEQAERVKRGRVYGVDAARRKLAGSTLKVDVGRVHGEAVGAKAVRCAVVVTQVVFVILEAERRQIGRLVLGEQREAMMKVFQACYSSRIRHRGQGPRRREKMSRTNWRDDGRHTEVALALGKTKKEEGRTVVQYPINKDRDEINTML